ncbi:hypothetical protein Tsubulata_020154 [Turnera subulata]|uniref:DUF4283 domain-containing protein n=1 Tax=Turnera subulata TaxID=218843 RepID=A0A9Q0G7E0_9ROSI|nr:hypothetical protein Tsubulata_020154 [Turnera subulata]
MLCNRLQILWGLRGSFRVIDLDHNYFLVKLSDRSDYTRALTGGPWVIMDHYLTVSPWQPNFEPASHKFTSVVAWIRVHGLSTELYQLAILKEISGLAVFCELIIQHKRQSGDDLLKLLWIWTFPNLYRQKHVSRGFGIRSCMKIFPKFVLSVARRGM